MKNPHIVALGGGTGLATLLRGLKHHTENLTAIVTIADDGGSSGRLRADLGIPPPGDARNCLVALSEDESLMGRVFGHRFLNASYVGDPGFYGHSLGNLLLAALSEMKGGFRQGLEAAAQLLAVSGRVIPVSDRNDLTLLGETLTGQVVRGESAIGHSRGLRRMWMEPSEVYASDTALEAIRQAALIVIGPGSLYTSVIPNFLICDVAHAVNIAKVPKVFICNVATQPHETDGYGVAEHVGAFQLHAGIALTHVIVNTNIPGLPPLCGQASVEPAGCASDWGGQMVYADVVDVAFPTRHDPEKLAAAIMGIAALDPAAL